MVIKKFLTLDGHWELMQAGGESMQLVELVVRYKHDGCLKDFVDLSSAIRGVWGRALRKTYCLQKGLWECDQCPFDRCVYHVIFEKQYGSYERFHPYIIQHLSTGPDHIDIAYKFIGRVCSNADKLLLSILRTDKEEIILQGDRHKLTVESITSPSGNMYYHFNTDSRIKRPQARILSYEPEFSSTLTIHMQSPLRQKSMGQMMSRFDWLPFAKSLISRIRYLDAYFNDQALILPEYIELPGAKLTRSEMFWNEKIRKSFRQNSKMSIGGLVGHAVLEDVSPEIHGMLKLGEALHCGKQTSFGNGKYKLEYEKCQGM